MIINELAVVFVAAAIGGAVAKFFRQPTLIGYLFAGFLVTSLGLVTDQELFSSLGRIGVALLLFLVGIEMQVGEFKAVGKVAITAGIAQIIFTTIAGFIIGLILGFPAQSAIYIALALTFSSTIVIVKLLSEKNDLQSLYGKISIGLLLVQDLVAVILMVFLTGLGQGSFDVVDVITLVLKGGIFFTLIYVLSRHVIPLIIDKFLSKSGELLFVGSIAWALGVAALAAGPFGFSLEAGGFIAGIAISSVASHVEIASRTRPLRDFFLTIFFFILGTTIQIANFGQIFVPVIILSLFVLVGDPLIVLIILGFLGHKKRTSFLTSINVAQVSEFSLIIMSMGVAMGIIGGKEMSTVVFVGVITIIVSTYMIIHAEAIYTKLFKFLKYFERQKVHEPAFLLPKQLKNHVVIVGCDRTGNSLVKFLTKKDIPFVVVDFNPIVFTRLTADGVPVVFGDISDSEVAEFACLGEAKAIISTTHSFTDNMSILRYIAGSANHPAAILRASNRRDALSYYEAGADLVVVPEMVAGEYIRSIIRTWGISKLHLEKIGKANFERLVYAR